MANDEMSSKEVAESVGKAIRGEAKNTVLQFGETRVLFSKGSQLRPDLPPMQDPPEYPDVPTKLTDDADSWLK